MAEVDEEAGKRLPTQDVHQEAAGKTKAWKSLQLGEVHQEEAEKTKDVH